VREIAVRLPVITDMSLAVVLSRDTAGLDVPLVTVECHADNGLPKFGLVGLTRTAVGRRATACARRCRTRIWIFPPRKITDGSESERPSYTQQMMRFDSHPKAELH
jgi:hypothetical protein